MNEVFAAEEVDDFLQAEAFYLSRKCYYYLANTIM